jgi:hypothetical protein
MNRLLFVLAGMIVSTSGASAQVLYGPAAIKGGTIDGVTITNSTTSGATNIQGTGTSGQYDARISVTGGGSVAGQGEVSYLAGFHHFRGWDGSEQFRVGLTPFATEFWAATGGPTSGGAVLFANNASTTGLGTGNVNGVFAAQNQGAFQFVNGSGPMFFLLDPGAPATSNLTITPGTATTDPSIGSTNNIAAVSVGSATGEIRFEINGAIMGKVRNITGTTTTGAYTTMWSNGSSLAGLRCENTSGTGPISCYIRAQSGGTIIFANDTSNLMTVATSALGTVSDSVLVRASSASQPIIFTSFAGTTSVGVGSPALAANSTGGFMMAPTCVAAPTGTPVQTTGWAPICYNPSTHTVNVYDAGASSWYHMTLTAGAG